MRHCIAFTCHVITPPIRSIFERLQREAPEDFDVFFVLCTNDAVDREAGPAALVHVSHDDLHGLGFPVKCRRDNWQMAGNLDLVFIEFANRHPTYGRYWFIEYDVHWEGRWSVLFEHFRDSPAILLATTIATIDQVPHKLAQLDYPELVVPPTLGWCQTQCLKAFLPLCRLDKALLDALSDAYRAGLGGHYEITVPSVAAASGRPVEDIGGNGPFVRPDNRNRFYFAHGSTYSHSPGSFVFRPGQRVLPCRNTLWHPVKPGDVPFWHPIRVAGSPLKTLLEITKPLLWRCVIRLWFVTRWRPLRS